MAEHAPQDAHREEESIVLTMARLYRDLQADPQTLAMAQRLITGFLYAMAMFDHLAQGDVRWQDRIIAECRSWRGVYGALVSHAPIVVIADREAETYARIMLWAAVMADGGDAYAEALEQNDVERAREAGTMISEATTRYLPGRSTEAGG